MTGDVLLSNMLFRYRDLPLGIKMPDSPDSLVKTQINCNSTNAMAGVNGNHSPHPPGGTPSPPMNSLPSSHNLETMPNGNGNSRSKHVIKIKRFLATLQQFASDMSTDVGERVHNLIIGLVSSSVTIEDFHHKIQEVTNYPLRPFAIPFLKSHLPILQSELMNYSRMAKQGLTQYLRQHENTILDTSSHPNSEPFEIFQSSSSEIKENGKRRSPSSRNGKMDLDYGDTNGDSQPPSKRHHPMQSPTLGSRTSPGAPPGLGLPPGLNLRIHEDTNHSYRDGRTDRYDRFDREFYRPFYNNIPRDFVDDRDMEEEWRNIYTMLNCILGMVEKTKRALCILQHRSYSERTELPGWIRHPEMEHKKSRPSDIVSHFKIAEDRVSEVRRRAEEAVNEVKRQAVAELQKAVSAAESKASELVAAERIKMERMLAEARRQAAEDALAVATHQEESTENCWNCGRKASETCSGCNIARYCGSFCQHKDWESHHRICGQTNSSHSATSSASTPPRTTSDHSPSPTSRSTNLIDIKPVKLDVV
ncbi:protein CBFA2T1 isoform X5 [Parasteatoda tepidariorum]|uniref:protein CBFA2T1 isoform X5 n=1 Tax=Parasteatoda tepidariorum TaxID=114398 RepID=UPI00077FB113|nr:protein CBFA2T1 isoform X3 [Parasteatoda tepidariorum]